MIFTLTYLTQELNQEQWVPEFLGALDAQNIKEEIQSLVTVDNIHVAEQVKFL